jgi:hypothetical protein
MKKRIIILSAILAAVILLAGCDAVLEGFFPEFKNTNAINVKYEAPAGPVTVALMRFELGDTAMTTPVKTARINREEKEFYVSFDGLPAGKYQVFVWHDPDMDELAGGAEQGKYATPEGSAANTFVFTEDDAEDFYTLVCDLSFGLVNPPDALKS